MVLLIRQKLVLVNLRQPQAILKLQEWGISSHALIGCVWWQRDLAALETNPAVSRNWKREMLCKSIAGNPVDLIWISEDIHRCSAQELANRKVVIISARVHPGETVQLRGCGSAPDGWVCQVASFVVRGVLQWLCSNEDAAIALRTKYQWLALSQDSDPAMPAIHDRYTYCSYSHPAAPHIILQVLVLTCCYGMLAS